MNNRYAKSISGAILEMAKNIQDDFGRDNATMVYKSVLEAEMEGRGYFLTSLREVYITYNNKRVWIPVYALLVDNKLILRAKANKEGMEQHEINSIKSVLKYGHYKEALLINFCDRNILNGAIHLKGFS